MLKNGLFFVIKPVCFCEGRKVCMCILTLQFRTWNSLESEPSLPGSDQWCWLAGEHAQCKTLCSGQNQGHNELVQCIMGECYPRHLRVILCLSLTNFWSLYVQKTFTVATFSTNITFSCWRIVSHSLGSWDLNDCFEMFFFFKSYYKWGLPRLIQPLLN